MPSTGYAVLAGRDPLEATVAAGSLVLRHEARRGRLLVCGVVVHVAISVGIAVLLAPVLPRRHTVAAGALAASVAAGVNLGLVGRRNERIAALPLGPQVADHLAYGAVVGAVLKRTRRDEQ